MSIRSLGQFGFINQFRMAFAPQDPKGGSVAQKSPYYGEITPHAYGDRLELRKPAAWDSLNLSLPKAEPIGGTGPGYTEPNGMGDMPDEPIGGGKVSKPSVVSMPSPNRNSRGGAKIDTIVLHHTAGGGTAQDVGRYFQNPANEVSSHYIVGKDGTIVQPVADGDRSWHAGPSEFKGRTDVNDFSLGIEIVNRGDGKDPYTDAQYVALGKLVAFMMSEYGIPMDRLTGHKDVALPRGR
ncbi:MAG: N-acetylmuramoyl-L-alanine amidase, partial [Candidatus Sericytochromatia bacterium]